MKNIIIFTVVSLYLATACAQTNKQDEMKNNNKMEFNKLTKEEESVIINKGTEIPFTGEYNDFYETGKYVCKRCDAVLYVSKDKFNSHCGWPSFDDAVHGAVRETPDADGRRTEITCNNCGAHLGHVFRGEGHTQKNTRHCVNSISMKFIPDNIDDMNKTDTAIFAGGCFWGVEYYMQKEPGVISTDVGYIGGKIDNPTYEEVCSHSTGFAEAVRIVFDPSKTTYEELAKLFFEIHDPTQIDRQGPDVGDQYRSEIFYQNEDQKLIAQKLINILKDKGYKVVTKLTPTSHFWMAEDYHQDYYAENGKMPYCHAYSKKF